MDYIEVRMKDLGKSDILALKARKALGVGILPGWKKFYVGDVGFMAPKPTGDGLVVGSDTIKEMKRLAQADDPIIEIKGALAAKPATAVMDDPADGPIQSPTKAKKK